MSVILKWGIGSSAACTMLVILASWLGGFSINDAHCLRVDDGVFPTGGLDLSTGAGLHLEYSPVDQARLDRTAAVALYVNKVAVSPDGQHMAYDLYNRTTGQQTLVVQHTAAFNSLPLSSMTVDGGLPPEPTLPSYSNFSWSPNGQWLAYVLRTTEGHGFVGIADRNGRQIHAQPIDATNFNQWIYYHGWSADGAFLALTIENASNPDQFTLSIWSGPDLTLTQTLDYNRAAIGSLVPFAPDTQIARWSPGGHKLAFLTVPAPHSLRLAIVSPGSTPLLADIPGQNLAFDPPSGINELPSFEWSPASEALAVMSSTSAGNHLDVVDAKTMRVSSLSDQILPLINDPQGGFISWTMDGHSLYYLEANPPGQTGKLLEFRLDTNDVQTLLPMVLPQLGVLRDQTLLLVSGQKTPLPLLHIQLDAAIDPIDTLNYPAPGFATDLVSPDGKWLFSTGAPSDYWLTWVALDSGETHHLETTDPTFSIDPIPGSGAFLVGDTHVGSKVPSSRFLIVDLKSAAIRRTLDVPDGRNLRFTSCR